MFDPRGPWSEHSHRALHSGDPCSIRARPAGIIWFTKEELFWLKFKYLKKMFRKKKLLQFIKPNRNKTVRVRVAWSFLAVYTVCMVAPGALYLYVEKMVVMGNVEMKPCLLKKACYLL